MQSFAGYVIEQLGRHPERILEVGAGAGELAVQLRVGGHVVTAIDPARPPAHGVVETDLETFEAPAGSFDAVVVNRALHHITDVDGAVEKLASWVKRTGMIVLQEFAWDRVDEATGAWLHSELRDVAAVNESADAKAFLVQWRAEHATLATYQDMRTALEARFELRDFVWVPYLAAEYVGRDPAAIRREAALLAAGHIRAAAFRCAARQRR